jgi:chromosome segregation ATPase
MSITRLTKASAAKFGDLSDSVEDANTRVLSIQRRIKETENQLRNLNHETDADGAAALQEEIKRLSDKREGEQATHLGLARTLTAVRTWLMQLSPSVALHDVPAKYYAGGENDGSSLESSVERCRADIFKLQSARSSVARSVLPVADLYAQADAQVDALAMQGRPKIAVDHDQLSIKALHRWLRYHPGRRRGVSSVAASRRHEGSTPQRDRRHAGRGA